MLFASTNNVLAKRDIVDKIIERRVVKFILIPWYLYIANTVIVVLILSDYGPLVSDIFALNCRLIIRMYRFIMTFVTF